MFHNFLMSSWQEIDFLSIFSALISTLAQWFDIYIFKWGVVGIGVINITKTHHVVPKHVVYFSNLVKFIISS